MISLRESPWVCFTCGAERSGGEDTCGAPGGITGCGSPRRFTSRILHVGQAAYRTDPDRIACSERGALWTCPDCEGKNRGAVGWRPVTSCAHCGAAREQAED
jgi:hypothetical protein